MIIKVESRGTWEVFLHTMRSSMISMEMQCNLVVGSFSQKKKKKEIKALCPFEDPSSKCISPFTKQSPNTDNLSHEAVISIRVY